MVEVSYMGTWTLGADNATVRNVPEPGPGSIQARRPIPQLEPHQRDPLRRQVDLSRRRRSRPSAGLRSNFAYNVSYTLSHSKDDASSPGATESETNVPQNVRQHLRRDRRVGALELRPSPSVRRQRRLSAAVLQRRRRRDRRRRSAAGAPTRSSSRSPARRSR